MGAPIAEDLERNAEVFRVLGHETRLRLLALIADGEKSVGGIEAASGIGQPGLSQQLAILRKAGLVATRRDAKLVYYRIDLAGFAPVAALVGRFSVGPEPAMPSAASAPRRTPARGAAATFAKIV